MKNSQVTDFWGAVKRIEKALNKEKAKKAAADTAIAKLTDDLAQIGELMKKAADPQTVAEVAKILGEE